MENTLIKDIYRNTENYLEKEIQISGWVRTIRDSKNFGFIEVNDGSFFSNIQVLTPTKKGKLGTKELNKSLQEALNPEDPGLLEKSFGGVIFREGDRVMQIKNNYDIYWEKGRAFFFKVFFLKMIQLGFVRNGI